ncbi:MAG: phage GP46 family protein [Methylobacter tundripaludum]|nr:phage GP46 family protein [Methylobacter tundripaludum]
MTAVALSPITRGYSSSNGVLARDPSGGLLNAAIIRILTPLGGYWAEPQLGSRLHELLREKDVQRVGKLARQYAEQALQGMVDDGRLTGVEVLVDQPHDGRLRMAIELLAATGQRWGFEYFVRVAA